MTTLFVNACAREESRTLSLCRAYLEGNPPLKRCASSSATLCPSIGRWLRNEWRS